MGLGRFIDQNEIIFHLDEIKALGVKNATMYTIILSEWHKVLQYRYWVKEMKNQPEKEQMNMNKWIEKHIINCEEDFFKYSILKCFNDIGFSEFEQRKSVKYLVKNKMIETKRLGIPATRYFKVLGGK